MCLQSALTTKQGRNDAQLGMNSRLGGGRVRHIRMPTKQNRGQKEQTKDKSVTTMTEYEIMKAETVCTSVF